MCATSPDIGWSDKRGAGSCRLVGTRAAAHQVGSIAHTDPIPSVHTKKGPAVKPDPFSSIVCQNCLGSLIQMSRRAAAATHREADRAEADEHQGPGAGLGNRSHALESNAAAE